MIEPDFLDELERFDASLKRRVSSIFHGEQKSTEIGEGLTFSDYRRYSPGDDTRLIDWKLYARTEELYIKQFEEERNLTIHVVVDASNSMDYGEEKQNKFEYGAKIGLGFAYLAATENNDFRFSIFTDSFERLDQGASNKGEIMRLIELLNDEELEGGADFSQALGDYSSTIKSRSMVLVVSDFLEETEEIDEGLEALADNHLTLAQVFTPEELELPYRGETILEDVETDFSLRTYLSNRLKRDYEDRLQNHIDSVEEISEELRSRHVLVNTGEDFFDSFAEVWVE